MLFLSHLITYGTRKMSKDEKRKSNLFEFVPVLLTLLAHDILMWLSFFFFLSSHGAETEQHGSLVCSEGCGGRIWRKAGKGVDGPRLGFRKKASIYDVNRFCLLWTPLPHTLTLLLVSKCNAHLVLWHPFVRTSCKEVPRCWWSWSGGASLPLAFSPLSHSQPPTANRFPVCQKNFSPLFQTSPPSLRESEACHVLGMFSMGTFIQPSKPPKAWFSSKYISRRELLPCSSPQELCLGCVNTASWVPHGHGRRVHTT